MGAGRGRAPGRAVAGDSWVPCGWRCGWWRTGSCPNTTTSPSSSSSQSPSSTRARWVLQGGRTLGVPWHGDFTMPTLPSAQSPAGTALAVLEEVTSGESRQEVATKLVKIFLGQGLAMPLLDYLITRELARTSKCQGWGHRWGKLGCQGPPRPPQGEEWGHRGRGRRGAPCSRGRAHQGWLGHHPEPSSPRPLRSSS